MLTNIKYNQGKQSVIGYYRFTNENDYRMEVNLLTQDITFSNFCQSYLKHEPSKLEIFKQHDTIKIKDLNFLQPKDFLKVLQTLIETPLKNYDVEALKLIVQEFPSLIQDIKLRIFWLQNMNQLINKDQQCQQTIKQVQGLNTKRPEKLTKLLKIKELDQRVTQFKKENNLEEYFQRLSKEKQGSGRFQTLYIIKTNLTITVNNKEIQLVKLGMTSKSIEKRLDSLYLEYKKQIEFSTLFSQVFYQKEIIDMVFHKNLTLQTPRSKFYILEQMNANKFKIHNEFFYLTQEFISTFYQEIFQFVEKYVSIRISEIYISQTPEVDDSKTMNFKQSEQANILTEQIPKEYFNDAEIENSQGKSTKNDLEIQSNTQYQEDLIQKLKQINTRNIEEVQTQIQEKFKQIKGMEIKLDDEEYIAKVQETPTKLVQAEESKENIQQSQLEKNFVKEEQQKKENDVKILNPNKTKNLVIQNIISGIRHQILSFLGNK